MLVLLISSGILLALTVGGTAIYLAIKSFKEKKNLHVFKNDDGEEIPLGI